MDPDSQTNSIVTRQNTARSSGAIRLAIFKAFEQEVLRRYYGDIFSVPLHLLPCRRMACCRRLLASVYQESWPALGQQAAVTTH